LLDLLPTATEDLLTGFAGGTPGAQNDEIARYSMKTGKMEISVFLGKFARSRIA
jgi:hypothetical protein